MLDEQTTHAAMPGSGPADAGSMRGRIQSQALVLVVERGYEGMSLRSIARRLDVTVAALYYHYPAKDDLLAAATRPAHRCWQP